jgi:tetrapyrrole methylase family protein/MazG family protein/ATP diphosphatase
MQNKSDDFAHLVSVISRLRAENGCPWDRRQTPETLLKYLLEETDELAEAIRLGNSGHIKEETGDLFYILILLTLMHEEKGEFSLNDVLSGITRKMLRRHPHVFAGKKTGSESDLRREWEAIKSRENNEKNNV